METVLTNDWITLSETRKGATVKRKFAGLDTLCNVENVMQYCKVKYWEAEFYPNGEISKQFLRSYSLTDLERIEWTENIGTEETPNIVIKFRNELKVLSSFIASLGNPYIVSPTRNTIQTLSILPLEHEEGYPLHRDTRTINTL